MKIRCARCDLEYSETDNHYPNCPIQYSDNALDTYIDILVSDQNGNFSDHLYKCLRERDRRRKDKISQYWQRTND